MCPQLHCPVCCPLIDPTYFTAVTLANLMDALNDVQSLGDELRTVGFVAGDWNDGSRGAQSHWNMLDLLQSCGSPVQVMAAYL